MLLFSHESSSAVFSYINNTSAIGLREEIHIYMYCMYRFSA